MRLAWTNYHSAATTPGTGTSPYLCSPPRSHSAARRHRSARPVVDHTQVSAPYRDTRRRCSSRVSTPCAQLPQSVHSYTRQANTATNASSDHCCRPHASRSPPAGAAVMAAMVEIGRDPSARLRREPETTVTNVVITLGCPHHRTLLVCPHSLAIPSSWPLISSRRRWPGWP